MASFFATSRGNRSRGKNIRDAEMAIASKQIVASGGNFETLVKHLCGNVAESSMIRVDGKWASMLGGATAADRVKLEEKYGKLFPTPTHIAKMRAYAKTVAAEKAEKTVADLLS